VVGGVDDPLRQGIGLDVEVLRLGGFAAGLVLRGAFAVGSAMTFLTSAPENFFAITRSSLSGEA
jgi:hypothetical protein